MNNRSTSKTIDNILLLTLTAVLFISGCKPSPTSKDEGGAATTAKPSSAIQNNIDNEAAKQLTDEFWQQGLTLLKETQQESNNLQKNINDLLADPNKTALLASYSQWEKTFSAYQELAPLTFIKHPSLSDALDKWRFRVAAWPLQPGYLDSYSVYIQSGIVNDITLPITTKVLRKQHGLTDPEEVTLGLYAIEFLLQGDKNEEPAKRFVQQTKVPLTLAQAGLKTKELPNNRRRQLLKLQGQLLLADLTLFTQQWQAGGLLSTLFLPLSPREKLTAYHAGLSSALDELQKLLFYKIENESGDDTKSKNNYQNRFEKNRKRAITKQLTVIESLYFSELEHADKKISFINTLIQTEQENVKSKIKEMRKLLVE